MGFYTCYKVECIVKPECVDIIKNFINNGYQWIINNDPIYDCIREWHNFLILHNNVLIYWTDSNNGYKKCAHYNPLIHDKLELLDKYIDYYNNPPNGPKYRWGQYCLLEKKNDKYMYIEYFSWCSTVFITFVFGPHKGSVQSWSRRERGEGGGAL